MVQRRFALRHAWKPSRSSPITTRPIRIAPCTSRGSASRARARFARRAAPAAAVVWSVAEHGAAEHVRIVPRLMEWCRWDRDAPWSELRRRLQSASQDHSASLANAPQTPTASRHARCAALVEFVGNAAMAAGATAAEIHNRCQRALNAYMLGQLRLKYDPTGARVVDIEPNDPRQCPL